ncbi:hypothetical protein F4810DRAFT_691891 [Camillea tinctor]|nr:hypothetical protein F4810DRAFT_691891 [Camillea tinctor]
MGLAPLGADVGDYLCILAGGKIPFVVRATHKDNSQAPSPFTCRLLEDSYTHGLMDSEAMQLVDSGELKVQHLELV